MAQSVKKGIMALTLALAGAAVYSLSAQTVPASSSEFTQLVNQSLSGTQSNADQFLRQAVLDGEVVTSWDQNGMNIVISGEQNDATRDAAIHNDIQASEATHTQYDQEEKKHLDATQSTEQDVQSSEHSLDAEVNTDAIETINEANNSTTPGTTDLSGPDTTNTSTGDTSNSTSTVPQIEYPLESTTTISIDLSTSSSSLGTTTPVDITPPPDSSSPDDSQPPAE